MPVEEGTMIALCLSRLAVLSIVVGALWLSACGGQDAPAQQSTAPVATVDPAVTFAPLVHFAEGERRFPLSASDFIAYSSLIWSNERCIVYTTLAIGAPRLRLERDDPRPPLHAARLGGRVRPYRHHLLRADCDVTERPPYSSDRLTRPYESGRPGELRGKSGFSLNLLTERLDGARRTGRAVGSPLRDVPVYVERQAVAADRQLLAFTYWMLYGMTEPDAGKSASLVAHEGGWERVAVIVREGPRGRYAPLRIRYWVHGEQVDVPWRDAELATADGRRRPTHPVVYAARGSHASYPSAGERRRRISGDGGKVTVRDLAEACGDCVTWRTWEDVRPVHAQPWWGYGGGWGAADGRFTSGPLGPYPGVSARSAR